MTNIDDVQRAMWAIEGLCTGCGCVIEHGDFFTLHNGKCEYDKTPTWREDLLKQFTTAKTITSVTDSTAMYMGRRVGKSQFQRMITEVLTKYRQDKNENTNS